MWVQIAKSVGFNSLQLAAIQLYQSQGLCEMKRPDKNSFSNDIIYMERAL
jgi:hypothetical protein